VKLNIIYSSKTLAETFIWAERYLGGGMRLIKTPLSIFEQYELRPQPMRFIPKIWSYRIIAKDDKYIFGTLIP